MIIKTNHFLFDNSLAHENLFNGSVLTIFNENKHHNR